MNVMKLLSISLNNFICLFLTVLGPRCCMDLSPAALQRGGAPVSLQCLGVSLQWLLGAEDRLPGTGASVVAVPGL